jgi:hypothetical protein
MEKTLKTLSKLIEVIGSNEIDASFDFDLGTLRKTSGAKKNDRGGFFEVRLFSYPRGGGDPFAPTSAEAHQN